MANLLENAGFENSITDTYAHWRGWYVDAEGAVCVYQKKTANPPTGFFQDIPGDRFTSNGTYRFQLKLLSPTENAWVKPTVWVFKQNQDAQPTQQSFNLRVGKWQIIEVDVSITRSNLNKVRAELYFGPTNAEMIIQRAYFGR
jgi:hypothetical protein